MGARLLLCSGAPTEAPVQLASGGLAEMVTEALNSASADRARLLIKVDRNDEWHDWMDIRDMADQPDFPVLI